MNLRDRPIGVFDSGVGGLTVLRALRAALPQEDFVYLGDTARLPYGAKTAHSVVRYSIQAARFLVGEGVKYVVVACNTASAAALVELRGKFAPTPVLGVIEPGAQAVCKASSSGRIAVLATEGTVHGGAYQRAIAALRPDATVSARACTVFVALAEEGWTEGPVAHAAAREYLGDLFASDPQIDAVLLGCTHFPVLAPALRAVTPESAAIVDSAQTTAAALRSELAASGLLRVGKDRGWLRLLATDGPERFARVGGRFLGESLSPADVELVDLQQAEI